MKKLYLVITLFLSLHILYGQVGINTETPEGIFHIDGKSDNYDNLGNKTNQNGDDVIVKVDGKLGIGTIDPSQKLTVVGNVRIADGTEKEGYMLVSDENGIASWKPQKTGKLVYANQDVHATLSASGNNQITATMQYKRVSITLPPGTWQVYFISTYENFTDEALNIWWDLIESSTSHSSGPHRVLSSAAAGINTTVSGKRAYAPVTAVYFITVQNTTTFYLWGQAQDKTSTAALQYSGEGLMWAMPI